MGSGTSNKTASDIKLSTNAAVAPTLPSLQQQRTQKTTKPPIIPEMSAGKLLHLY